MILYTEDEILGGQRGAVYRGGKPNPNKQYMKHFDNSLILTRLLQVSTSIIDRYQAQKELACAERKMKYWSQRPGFDKELAANESLKLKALWDKAR